MRDRHLVLQICLKICAGTGLLHIVEHLGKIILARVEIFQAVHHHACAVVVVGVVVRVNFIVGHGEILAHGLFVVAEAAEVIEHGGRDLVVRIDQAHPVTVIQRRAGSGYVGIARDLACGLELVVIQVQRQLVGAGRDHKGRLVIAVFLACDGIVVAEREIRLVQGILLHKFGHQALERLPGYNGCGRTGVHCARGGTEQKKRRGKHARGKASEQVQKYHSLCLYHSAKGRKMQAARPALPTWEA